MLLYNLEMQSGGCPVQILLSFHFASYLCLIVGGLEPCSWQEDRILIHESCGDRHNLLSGVGCVILLFSTPDDYLDPGRN